MSTPTFLHGLLSNERENFHNVVSAVLDDGLDLRPEPKCRTPRELIGHLIAHCGNLVELLDDGVIHHRMPVPVSSAAEGARQLDEGIGRVLDSLSRTDASHWEAPARFLVGDELLFEGPRQQITWVLFLDCIHHRGQLSTYLRPMGSRVPSIYGPSADDPGPAG